jgi:predicted nucleic acid-binding Zn ribbon protein
MGCRYIGVDRVLLHDNNEDGGQQAADLSDFITDGFLSYFTVQGEAQQIPVYQYCVTQSGQQFSWLAALDIDEFIVVEDARASQRRPSNRLKTVLQEFRFQPGYFPSRHPCRR